MVVWPRGASSAMVRVSVSTPAGPRRIKRSCSAGAWVSGGRLHAKHSALGSRSSVSVGAPGVVAARGAALSARARARLLVGRVGHEAPVDREPLRDETLLDAELGHRLGLEGRHVTRSRTAATSAAI